MNARATALLLATAGLTLLAGCGFEATPPALDATWGMSVRMAVENQKLDPTPASDRPVAGLDGVFAKNALDGYRKSSEVDSQTGKAKEPKMDAILLVKEAK